MRSFLSVVVMLSLCLVSFKRTATGDVNDDVNPGSERQNSDVLNKAVVTTTTTTAAKVINDQVDNQVNDAEEPGEKEQEEERGPQPQPQPQSQPQPDHVGGSEGSELQPAPLKAPEVRQPDAEAPAALAPAKDPEDPKDTDHHEGHKGSKGVAPPTSLPAAHSEPGKPLGDQQQQQGQQSQLPQEIPPQVSAPKDQETGGVSQNQNHAAPTRTSEDELDTSHIVPQARTPDERTGQPEHQAPEPRPEEQHSPSSHSTGGVVKKTEATQPKTEKQTDNAQSGRSPPQGQPQTQPIIKSKTPDNDTTKSGTGASPAEKKNVPPKKPTPTSTPAADNAVHQTAPTTGDKETHTEQTSVSSTSEPVKGKSTPPSNTSEKLSKALQSLDTKDNSIGCSLVCALASLATLVLVAVAPPS